MAAWTLYDEVGVKEDVSDIITNISPTKTPFLSTLKTEKVHQKRHDWQEDALDAAASERGCRRCGRHGNRAGRDGPAFQLHANPDEDHQGLWLG
jgi:hypothetical protein